MTGVFALVVLVSGFPLMTGSFRIASGVFLILGSVLLFRADLPVAEWLSAASSMCNIVVIVAVMQSFTVPIRSGGYNEALRVWSEQRFSNRTSLFGFITVVTNILASFLNIGAVPVLVSLLEDSLRKRLIDYRRFFSVSMSRAYFLMVLWSPGSINLYLVVQATGVPWFAVFVPGLLITILGMGLSLLVESGRGGLLSAGSATSMTERDPLPPAAGRPETSPPRARESTSRVAHIPVVAMVFVLLIFGMERAGFATSGQRIVFAGALVSVLWTLLNVRRPGLANLLGLYWKDGLLKAAQVGPFFVSMGVFSTGLRKSGLLDLLAPHLQAAVGALGPVSVAFVAALIVGLSVAGLHPFITITLFGTMLSGTELPIPPLTVALALSVGGAAAYMISPFAGVIMTIARLLDVRPADLAIRWNGRYSLLFMVLGLVLSFAWGRLFG